MERLFKGRQRRISINFSLFLLNIFLTLSILGGFCGFILYKITLPSKFKFLSQTNQTYELSITLEKNILPFYTSTYNLVSTEKLEQNSNNVNEYTSKDVILSVETLPKRVSFDKLSKNIAALLSNEKDLNGIYVYDFSREKEAGVNQDKEMPPASISKVPLAINILKIVDEGKLKLDQKIKILYADYTYPSNVLNFSNIGYEYTISELLGWMIIDSDNISLVALERVLGGYEVSNQMTKDNLGVDPFFRYPHKATAKNVGSVFRGIYQQDYLSKESNVLLLNLLKNTADSLQEEIPPGIPKGTVIAHKTGRVETDNGFTLEDAGIVYGKDTDYIIVFLNYDIQTDQARKKINEISELVYNTLN